MDPKTVAAAIEALLAAPTPDDGLAVLRCHAEALGDAMALELIDSNVERLGEDPDGDPETRDLLLNRRLIIDAFQRAGLDGAAAVMRGEAPAGAIDESAEAVNRWLAADSWAEAYRILEANDAVLLGETATRLLDEAARRYADDPHGGPKVEDYRALSSMARQHGLTEARRWLCRQLLLQIQGARAAPPEQQAACFETLLELTDPEGDREAWLAVNINYGSLLRELDRPQEAIDRFETALESLSPESDPEHFGGTHRSLGNIYVGSEAADPTKAVFHFNQALRTTTQDNDPVNYLHIHHMLGLAHRALGQRAEALLHFREAAAGPAPDDADQWAQAAADLANEQIDDYGPTRQRSLVEAIACLERALDHLDAEADADRWARTRRNLGMAYRDVESQQRVLCLDKAIAHSRAALSVWTRETNAYRWAQVQHNLGTIHYLYPAGDALDNLNQAQAHYEAALAVHTRADHPDDWALTQAALGMCLIRRRSISGDAADLDAAIGHIRNALSWWTGDGDDGSDKGRNYCAEAWNALGAALVERAGGGRDLEDAVDALERARAGYAELGMDERRRSVEMNLASAWSKLSDRDPSAFPRARDNARRAMAATSRDTDPYSWAIFQRNYAALLANSGSPADRGEARACLEAALEVFTREHFAAEHARTLGFLGHLRFPERDWDGALAAYAAAIAATEDVLGAAYTESGEGYQIAETSLYFMRAAYCLVELGRADEALVMLDRGKGRALALDLSVNVMLRNATRGAAGEALAAAARRHAELEARMREPPTRSGRPDDAELGRALKASKAELGRLIADSGVSVASDLDLDGILAAIPAGGAMVALLVTSAGSVAFVLPAGTTAVGADSLVRVPFATADLHGMLIASSAGPGLLQRYVAIKTAASDAAADRAQQRYDEQLERCCAAIWRELLAPVAARLAELGVPRDAPLCLLPQGGLGMLPLHAACDETVAADDPRRWPLLERYSVSYAPSAYALVHARRARERRGVGDARRRTLVAAINPTLDLDFAEIEGALVAALFTRLAGADSATTLRGLEATEAAVRPLLNRSAYLHFACHGSFDFRDAGGSALHLAGGDALELAELMGPDFDFAAARLVTLSACETGMTEFQRSPDEYVGLPATFLRAGAPAVLSTLWEVDDIASAILVSEFYRHHLGDGLLPAAALRAAQRWLRGAASDEIAAWISAAATLLHSGIGDGDGRLERALGQLEAVGREVENGAFGAQPFRHPFYWAAFALVGE